jgi:hypothetical protein
MENAFHLGMWALVLSATLGLVRAAERGEPLRGRGWLSGLAGALLFATRPESVVCVAALGVYAAIEVRRTSRARGLPGGGLALATLFRIGLPGAFAVVAQALANRIFTGEWTANGAIAKLTLNDPYMPAQEKWWEYLFLLKYVVVRNTEHHFAEGTPGKMGWGWLVVFVAAVPLFDRRTRKPALVLWSSAIGWLALVALNRQVRWQNERYTMSAVAWVLVLFALGLAILAGGGLPERIAARIRTGAGRAAVLALRVTATLALIGIYWWHELPQMRDQIWFFGRASRNIRDQHLVAGERLDKLGAQRVLVGDAGALMYASDLPGLDLIGLGGYHDLPFAPACTGSAPRSSSSSACCRTSGPTPWPSTPTGGATSPRSSAGAWTGSPSTATSSAAGPRRSSTRPTGRRSSGAGSPGRASSAPTSASSTSSTSPT